MKTQHGKSIIGIILILLGILFTVDNLNLVYVDFSDMLFSFPTILFFVGITSLGKRENGKNLVAYLFVALGIIGWVLNFYGYSLFEIFIENWPLLIIIIGILILLKGFQENKNPIKNTENEFNENQLDKFVILNSFKTWLNSQNFIGGKLSLFMAGAEIDMRKAKIEGTTATLDLNIIMGGCELVIPPHWKVLTNTTTIFGGSDDQRMRTSADPGDQAQTLIINGIVLFGGLELK